MRPPLWNTDRMTDQPDDSPRRVVKKVVKKTVVRPVASSAPRSATSTRHGAARLTTPARPQRSRPVNATVPKTVAPTVPRATSAPAPTAPPAAAEVPRRRLPTLDVRARSHEAVIGVRHRVEDAWDWVVSFHLPHLPPVRGSAIAGLVVGVLSVLAGWGFYELFSATLGTRAGGRWGFLAFVFLSFVAFFLGEVLLAGFGVPHARVVSSLAVLLVLLLVLVFFIDLAAGIWAWLLIPLLTAFAFVASTAAMRAAAKEQNPQRLPWEPMDESQVNRD